MNTKVMGCVRFLLSSIVVSLLLIPALANGQVALVQGPTNNGGSVYRQSVSVTFPGGQTAGDLNLVVVGWNDISSTIASVQDSAGNTYVLAAGTVSTALPALNASPAGVSQAIYYAKNIKAVATNTITVTFNSFTAGQDVRILEYGTAPNGLDVAKPVRYFGGNLFYSEPCR